MSFLGYLVQLLLHGPGALEPDSIPSPAPETSSQRFRNYGIDVLPPDYGTPLSSSVLLTHEFSASWGKPFTVPYSAPQHDFTNVELTLEVETFGVQYDRLAHLYLNGIEVWRPSTSEPLGRPSFSTYTKDLSAFLPLFAADGELSFELNNIVTDNLDGTFNVTLSASYYSIVPYEGKTADGDSNLIQSPNVSEWYQHERRPPNSILPLLKSQVATGAVFGRAPKLSRNTTRAVLQLFASGNGDDEFWYVESSLDPSDDKTGPVRQIYVEIDGEIAGVVTPFQQIYTGGYQPRLWSPFVGLKAYDVPYYHIDVTPFLPDLWTSGLPVRIVVRDTSQNVVTHQWILSAALLTWEEKGVYGMGVRYPTTAANHTTKVLLPGVEVVSASSTVNSSADLWYVGKSPIHVEWIQSDRTQAVLSGELIAGHLVQSASHLSYDDSSYGTENGYGLGLGFNETSISISQVLTTNGTNSPESLLPLDSRNQELGYNGSWNRLSSDGPDENGADIFVDVTDPWQIDLAGRPRTYLRRGISRDGKALHVDSSSDFSVDDLMADVFANLQQPTTLMSAEQLDRNRKIRHSWLRHHIL